MKALVLDGALSVRDIEKPRRASGEVLIAVKKAGICRTDHEIVNGYIPNFSGVLGHEFLGVVAEADDASLIGRRVTAEINAPCGVCEMCRRDLERHCPHRTVLGINGRNGAFAEFVSVPRDTVVSIPDDIPDALAIFMEPLAAAYEILEQVHITADHSVLLLGDGKLAMLIALVLKQTGCRLQVVGKHARKLTLIKEMGIPQTLMLAAFVNGQYDVVVEASGNPEAFALAVANTRPRGTFVLKSTYVQHLTYNPSPIVVNEITVVGSRCGRFPNAIRFLQEYKPPLQKMITAEFPLAQAVEAFDRAKQSDALKVLLTV
jgi:threonine dehydrogenase-like Zn-dependent dehydrogenase